MMSIKLYLAVEHWSNFYSCIVTFRRPRKAEGGILLIFLYFSKTILEIRNDVALRMEKLEGGGRDPTDFHSLNMGFVLVRICTGD